MITESALEEGDVSGSNYVRKTDAEIKELALQLYRGEIFTSLQISEHDLSLISSIFMPLLLLNDLSRKQLILNDAYCFYDFLKNAGPRSVNGYPCFFSCYHLNREDTRRLIDKFHEIEKVMSDV